MQIISSGNPSFTTPSHIFSSFSDFGCLSRNRSVSGTATAETHTHTPDRQYWIQDWDDWDLGFVRKKWRWWRMGVKRGLRLCCVCFVPELKMMIKGCDWLCLWQYCLSGINSVVYFTQTNKIFVILSFKILVFHSEWWTLLFL